MDGEVGHSLAQPGRAHAGSVGAPEADQRVAGGVWARPSSPSPPTRPGSRPYLRLDPVQTSEPQDLAPPQLALGVVYLLPVLVELLLGDFLLLREPARLLEELEPAGRDGGDDLRKGPAISVSIRGGGRLLSLTHLVTVNSSPPFPNPIFRFLSNSLPHPESAGHGGKSWELDIHVTLTTPDFTGHVTLGKSCNLSEL